MFFNLQYNGYLGQIKRESDQLPIWGANTMNARGQIEQYTYGNGLVNHSSFSHGYVTGTRTEDVQEMCYGWDFGTGNLLSRLKETRR
jgi:hypothetical protein